METSDPADLLKKLADDIAALCKSVLETNEIKVVDRSSNTYDDADGSGHFVMAGTLHKYTIVRVEVRHLFGWRWLKYEKHHPLVRVTGETAFYGRSLVWPFCTVYNAHLEALVRPLFERVKHHPNTLTQRDSPSFVVETT